jgi:hypothetical protein
MLKKVESTSLRQEKAEYQAESQRGTRRSKPAVIAASAPGGLLPGNNQRQVRSAVGSPGKRDIIG